ncbi:MAG: hypothetical protein Q8N37_01445 [bacterium]|nr:hypothetical protein [bacterium]
MKLSITEKTLLLAGIILAILLYTVAVYESGKKTPVSLTPTPNASSILLTTPETDISNWKTYTNNQYGFEINYPENLKTEQPVPNVFIIYAPNNIEYLQISNASDTIPPRPENYIPNLAKFVGTVNIGDKKADKYYTNNPQGEGGIIENTSYTDYVVILDEKRWVHISYFGEKEIANLFETIISTFKFLNK